MSQGIALRTVGLQMAFGGLSIFRNLNFSLDAGSRHAVIGPNGAGKSTFVNLLTGLLRPTGGSVLLGQRDITRETPQKRVHAGLVRTFQLNTLFPALSPLESMVLALCQRDGCAGLSLRSIASKREQIEEAFSLLERFGLSQHASQPTRMLSYGQQRLLEVALAYALRPQVLLLDEPAAGLSTTQGHALFEQLAELTVGTTLLFIEHDMDLVFRYADKISVFAGGDIIAEGTPEEVRSNNTVREAYLGN
jgi:branched-chain amino acid transport system ATP-binding protein